MNLGREKLVWEVDVHFLGLVAHYTSGEISAGGKLLNRLTKKSSEI